MKMLRITVILFGMMLISNIATGTCPLAAGSQQTTLTIGTQLISISADAAIDTSTPVAQFDSTLNPAKVVYNCDSGTEYGKRVINLTGQNSSTRIYPTNVSGLGVKLLYNNASDFGNFPSTSNVSYPSGETTGVIDFPIGSFYRIQFFKTGNLTLRNPAGDAVLPSGVIAYNYFVSDNPASYGLQLNIGEISVISTPTCTADGAKTIDFNTVTPTLLSAGVNRDLNFSITCKSDYGSYAAKASIVADTPSSDGTYIRVKDADGNLNRLAIRITDGSSQVMKVDGTTAEDKSDITSRGPADFTWKAMLVAGTTATPSGGTFNAKAEIVFDIK